MQVVPSFHRPPTRTKSLFHLSNSLPGTNTLVMLLGADGITIFLY